MARQISTSSDGPSFRPMLVFWAQLARQHGAHVARNFVGAHKRSRQLSSHTTCEVGLDPPAV